jgi:hypothetical protein
MIATFRLYDGLWMTTKGLLIFAHLSVIADQTGVGVMQVDGANFI